MIEGQSDTAFHAFITVSAGESITEVDGKAFGVSYPVHATTPYWTLRSLLFRFHPVPLGGLWPHVRLSHQCRFAVSDRRAIRRVSTS